MNNTEGAASSPLPQRMHNQASGWETDEARAEATRQQSAAVAHPLIAGVQQTGMTHS